MNKQIAVLSQALIALFVFSSCQKEIDLNLDQAESRIVIEGELTDQPTPYQVKVSRTVNFNEPNVFPGISGALVVLSDNNGNIDTLAETATGVYTGNTLQGIPGRSYMLSVSTAGVTYTAISIMPLPVDIDTIRFQNSFFGNEKVTVTEFHDPGGIENYYRLIMFHNGTQNQELYTTSDRLRDGQRISTWLFADDDEIELLPGDSVRVVLRSIDQGVYDYFRTLDQAVGGTNSASPANPTSNISNGALGYFTAFSQRVKTTIVP